jgi:hypothetical protein
MFSYSTGYYVSPPIDQYLKFKNRCSLKYSHRGGLKISNPGSPNKQCENSSTGGGDITFGGSSICFGEDQREMQNVGEFKLANWAARTAMRFALLWNFSVHALEGFMHNSEYCSKDLAGETKPVVVLSQFCNFIFAENAKRWRGKEPFVAQGKMRSYWEAFYGSRPKTQPEKEAPETKKCTGSNATQQQHTARPFENICICITNNGLKYIECEDDF